MGKGSIERLREAKVGENVSLRQGKRDVLLEVVDGGDCAECYMDSFYGDRKCPFYDSCNLSVRADRRNVIFREVVEGSDTPSSCVASDGVDVYDEEGDVNVGGDIEKLTVADLKMAKCFLEEDLTDLICKFEEKTGVSVRGLGFNKDMSVIVDLDI